MNGVMTIGDETYLQEVENHDDLFRKSQKQEEMTVTKFGNTAKGKKVIFYTQLSLFDDSVAYLSSAS
jgi:hypothetical protein